MMNMLWPEPRSFTVDLAKGELTGTGSRYQKRFSDLTGLYADAQAFEERARTHGDEVVYEVTDYHPSARTGDLITGVTRMSPGKVGNEYFMTRGHIHAISDRPELYFGLKGKGLMLMESVDGVTRIAEISPMAACYVPPFWIHRSVNVGADDLLMLFCYPADSGQDYDIIQRSNGLKQRVIDDGKGGWLCVDNPDYRQRSAAEIGSIQSVAAQLFREKAA